MRRVGLSNVGVRWLMARELVQHRSERPSLRDGRRQFSALCGAAVTPSSCFVATEAGLIVANWLADRIWYKRGEQHGRPDRAVPRPHNLPAPMSSVENPRPRYDADRNEFTWGDQIVKRFRTPAPNQRSILLAFETLGWPIRIDDPLPPADDICPSRRLSETIRALNRRQVKAVVRFSGDGSGCGILWNAVR